MPPDLNLVDEIHDGLLVLWLLVLTVVFIVRAWNVPGCAAKAGSSLGALIALSAALRFAELAWRAHCWRLLRGV